MNEPIHVMPVNDLKDHTCSEDCWCKPTKDDEYDIYTHHSLDGRELVENGERLKQ